MFPGQDCHKVPEEGSKGERISSRMISGKTETNLRCISNFVLHEFQMRWIEPGSHPWERFELWHDVQLHTVRSEKGDSEIWCRWMNHGTDIQTDRQARFWGRNCFRSPDVIQRTLKQIFHSWGVDFAAVRYQLRRIVQTLTVVTSTHKLTFPFVES